MSRSRLSAYGLAALATGLALISSLGLWSIVEPNRFTLFLGAVALSAWYGGSGPAALAMTLSVMGLIFFLEEPKYSILPADSRTAVRMIGFILVGSLITALTSTLRSAQQRAAALAETEERRVAERTRELSALYDVTAVASASLDLETIMRRSLERIVTMMGSTIGLIQLVDEKSGRLWLAAAYGATDDTLSQLNSSPHLQDLASTVLNPGLPVVIADLTTDSRTAGVAAALGVHSYAGVPLRAKGQNRGVLNLARHRSRPFRIEEVALLASVADQVGVAVEHARLFKTVQDQAALEERQRLARELHDSVTQSLYSLTLLAEAARRLAVTGDLTRVAEYVGRLGEISQQALKEMRLLVYELRPLALEREGLVGALQQRLEAVEQRAGVKARLQVEGSVELPPRLEEGLYRIAQEALNNALKHASATDVSVVLRADHESVDLEVMDNGTGFDLTTLNSRGGLGLATMRERAEQLGGRLHICTQPGEGTRVQLHTDCSNG